MGLSYIDFLKKFDLEVIVDMHRLRVDWERIYIMVDKNLYHLNKLTRIGSMFL